MVRTSILRILSVSAVTAVSLLPIARAQTDVVTDWNMIALTATALAPNSILQSRALAIVHGAIYDVVCAVERQSGAYAVDIDAPVGTSVEAAAAAAGHGALVRLAPTEQAMLDAALKVSLSKIADGQVKSLGARNSTTRTADQTATAIFWTVQTAVPWHAAARAASASRALSLAENASSFALLTMASADSQIIAFEEKYKRPHWRPITAIRAATDLNISVLKGATGWEPLLVTSPHPEYPSAHAIFSGAAEAVLRGFFGNDEVDVSVTAPGPFGVTRTYHRFSELTEEVDNARVWGGIHFRSADSDGAEIGRKISEIALREFPNLPRKTTRLGDQP